MMMMTMMMGAYNGAGSVIHWMTPPPLTSHLKTFWGPKFELLALKILEVGAAIRLGFATHSSYNLVQWAQLFPGNVP